MYLWWCSNVYKRLQSFIWRYFYCAFLRFCLGLDSNVQPGVGKFGCIWLEWFARGQGIWLKIFEKSQIPTLCPASPPAGITLIGALLWPLISGRCNGRVNDGYSTMSDGIFDGIFPIVHRTFLMSYFRGCWLLDFSCAQSMWTYNKAAIELAVDSWK